MELLKHRAGQLARQLDAQRQAAGEPSMLDLRPDRGPFVSFLYQAWHDLKSVDGWSGHAEVPWERQQAFLERWGLPEEARLVFRAMTRRWNDWREENRPEAKGV